MAAVAGPSPWNRSAYDEFRSGFKRITRRRADDVGSQFFMSWDPETDEALSSGWRSKQTDGWDQQPVKENMRRLRLYNGRYVNVPDHDYQDFIGHQKTEKSDASVIDYISTAFDDKHHFERWDTKVGHIEYMWYSPTYQLLLVGFASDDAEVCYFRVPKEVYSELLHHAKTGDTYIDDRGADRHVLGKVFWNIIRIRGNKHGSRYKFQYTKDGVRKQTVGSTSIVDVRNEFDRASGRSTEINIPESEIASRVRSIQLRDKNITYDNARKLAIEQGRRARDVKGTTQ